MIHSFCTRIIRRLYPIFLDVKKEWEGRHLINLKHSKGPIRYGDGSIFIGVNFISIGADCGFGRSCRIEAISIYHNQSFSPELIIGNNVTIEDWCHIGCIEKVEIGEGTMISSRVFITDHFHGTISSADLSLRPALRPLSSKPVNIGRNVWIGEGVSIMPGVSLGDNVIVGANAVVTHSFGPNVVIAGCPAKVIRVLGV